MNISIDLLSTAQHLKKLYEKSFYAMQEREGLTQIEIDILLFLSNNPRYDTASEIVEFRGLSKSHVSAAVEKLIHKGFLSRSPDKADRRCIHLTVEDKALGVVEELKQVQRDFFALLYHGITDEERALWNRVLGKLEENVKNAFGK